MKRPFTLHFLSPVMSGVQALPDETISGGVPCDFDKVTKYHHTIHKVSLDDKGIVDREGSEVHQYTLRTVFYPVAQVSDRWDTQTPELDVSELCSIVCNNTWLNIMEALIAASPLRAQIVEDDPDLKDAV